jgi:hypothetical protein
MTMNEDVHRMRVQILNLRSAGLACATAVHFFPPCGRPGGDHLQCPEARVAMQKIYKDMKDLLLSARMALAAVFNSDPDAWDFLCEVHDEGSCTERDIATFGAVTYSNQDEFIKSWGEIVPEMADQLGTGFSESEWKTLTTKDAWQNRRRLPQILHLLTYLEDQIAKQFDLFDSVLHSGLLGDCNLGKWAAKKAASA